MKVRTSAEMHFTNASGELEIWPTVLVWEDGVSHLLLRVISPENPKEEYVLTGITGQSLHPTSPTTGLETTIQATGKDVLLDIKRKTPEDTFTGTWAQGGEVWDVELLEDEDWI